MPIGHYDEPCFISGNLTAQARGTGGAYAMSVVWRDPNGREYVAFGDTRAECEANALADIETWRAHERANAAAEAAAEAAE